MQKERKKRKNRVPGEIMRKEVKLDLQVSPEEIMSRELELGCESWTSFASGCSSTAVQRTLSLWLCPARQLKHQLRSALVAAQWRGDTALTLPLFWQQTTVSPGFFRRYLRSSLHSLALFPPLSPSLKSNLASVDVKQHGQGQEEKEKNLTNCLLFSGNGGVNFQPGNWKHGEVKIQTQSLKNKI